MLIPLHKARVLTPPLSRQTRSSHAPCQAPWCLLPPWDLGDLQHQVVAPSDALSAVSALYRAAKSLPAAHDSKFFSLMFHIPLAHVVINLVLA